MKAKNDEIGYPTLTLRDHYFVMRVEHVDTGDYISKPHKIAELIGDLLIQLPHNPAYVAAKALFGILMEDGVPPKGSERHAMFDAARDYMGNFDEEGVRRGVAELAAPATPTPS